MTQPEIELYARAIAAAIVEAAFSTSERTGGKVWHGLKDAYQWLHQTKMEKELRNLLQDIFGMKGTVGLLPGAHHRQLPNMWHPDNVDAADKVQQYISQKKLATSFKVINVPTDNNLIVLGSPTSSVVSRKALGYWRGSRLVIPGGEAPIGYKIYFSAPNYRKTAKRYVGKKEYHYRLCSLVTKDGKAALEPLLVKNERQVTDVLVVSRIPNLESEDAFNAGMDEILICGLQGPGTKAIGLLLQDLDTLKKLKERIGGARYYQAIMRVNSIKSDDQARETIPENISFFDAYPLDIDPDRITAWFSRLSPRE